MRSCSFARAISSTGRCAPEARSWCGTGCGAGDADARAELRAAFGRRRDGVLVRDSATLGLPDLLQALQQHFLSGFVVGEGDLLEVQRELKLRELTANLVLVIELRADLLLDHACQPQQSADRAERRRG